MIVTLLVLSVAAICHVAAAGEDARFASARRTMDYDLTVCGIRHRFENGTIDWEYNPTTNGYREWTWCLARQDFLLDLATYRRMTGDERAARVYVDIISGFIDREPPPPASVSPYKTSCWRTIDTGLRASRWMKTFDAFTNSPAFTAEFRTKFLRSLADHRDRLRPPRTTGNWRIMELRGLVDILLAFPSLDPNGDARRQAEGELKAVLETQLYPDGFQFELTPGYHSLLDANFCLLADAYRRHGMTPPEFLEAGLERAFALYVHLMTPDRGCPVINDSSAIDVVTKMKKASALYPARADFLWLATNGKQGRCPDFLSCALPFSGAVVFRDSWSREAVWGYVDMSPFGHAHQHEDKLNFLLRAYGKVMLTEGGNYAYDTSDMRRYVLSTRSHNTVRIDGHDQNARKSWKWTDDMLTKKAALTFSSAPERDCARAAYDLGYGSAADRTVFHARSVEFVKDGAPWFRIVDKLVACDDKEHTYEQLWHLAPCELKLSENSFIADFGDGVGLTASFESENGRLVDLIGRREPELQGWLPVMPPGAHEHTPIHTPTLKGSFRGRATLVVEFRPRRNALNPSEK